MLAMIIKEAPKNLYLAVLSKFTLAKFSLSSSLS